MKEKPLGEQEDWKQSSQNLQLQNSDSQLKISQLHRSSTGRALKTHWAYFQEIWRLQETDPALLGHAHNLSCSQSLCRVSGLKDTWVRPTCASQSASQKSKRQLGLQLGMDTGRPHLESTLQLMSVKGLPHRPPCLQHSCTTRPCNQTHWGLPCPPVPLEHHTATHHGGLPCLQHTHHNHIMQGLTSIQTSIQHSLLTCLQQLT